MARPFIESGRLVAKAVERPTRLVKLSYAWHTGGASGPGRALQWWLGQLQSAATQHALLEMHRVPQ